MPSLADVFLFLTVVGGAIVVLQSLASLVGVGTDAVPDHDFDVAHGHDVAGPAAALGIFNYRSVRAIAAGIGFAGLGGMLALRRFDGGVALALAVLLGVTIWLFVAFVMRGFTRLDADHSVHPMRAIGLGATVSLPIPARGDGPGKVTLIVAGRRVEWPAVQAESAMPAVVIPSGTPVHIVDSGDDTTLTVVALPHS